MTLLYTIEDQSENDSMELRKSLLEDEWVVFNTVTNRPHFIGTEAGARGYWAKLYA